jgi:hypothetical protein
MQKSLGGLHLLQTCLTHCQEQLLVLVLDKMNPLEQRMIYKGATVHGEGYWQNRVYICEV